MLQQVGSVGSPAGREALPDGVFSPAVQSPGCLGKHADLAGVLWRLLNHLAHHSYCSRHERTGQCYQPWVRSVSPDADALLCECFPCLVTMTNFRRGWCCLLSSKCIRRETNQVQAPGGGGSIHRNGFWHFKYAENCQPQSSDLPSMSTLPSVMKSVLITHSSWCVEGWRCFESLIIQWICWLIVVSMLRVLLSSD